MLDAHWQPLLNCDGRQCRVPSNNEQHRADEVVLVEERRQKVLDFVQRQGMVTMANLSELVGVSESTIRRDLEYWHRQGLLRRIHGGAMAVGDPATVTDLDERAHQQISEKQRIARAAAERIQDGDAVLLDGGTTTYELARLLVGRPLQVVTNSLPIAELLSTSRETDLILLGGYVYGRTGVALGPQTVRMMEEIHVQQTLMSVSGITHRGLFNSNLLLVESERAMMRCADEVVVLADHTKIGRQALTYLCDLATIDTLIVDDGLTHEQQSMIDVPEVRLVVVRRPKHENNGGGNP
jgi:DeoR/GlpR family transcriptional regulator of sugar metabolism